MSEKTSCRKDAPEIVLVLNCYPTQIEFEWFRMAEEDRVLAKGMVDQIGTNHAVVVHERYDGRELHEKMPVSDVEAAIREIAHQATSGDLAIIKSTSDILCIGHRVVHGGEKFTAATLITDEVKKSIEGFKTLAPLHNACNLAGIEGCEKVLPGIPNVAVFDTAFHHSMPPSSYLYAIPYEFYQKYGIRKYGFHGSSHQFVVKEAASLLGQPAAGLKLITIHLGRGCSVAAVDGGKVIDTSMGMTPLPGLIMATRCGDIDPAVVLYLARQNMSADEIDTMLNTKSGLLGLAGVGSGDIRDVIDAANKNSQQAGLALWAYVQRIVSYIGAYYALLGGADAIVFTGGIGTHNPYIRARVIGQLGVLGCHLSETKNFAVGKTQIISDGRSSLKAIAIPSNEELMIAREIIAVMHAQANPAATQPGEA